MIKRKKCNRCLKFRMADKFFKDTAHSSGLYSICKDCKTATTMEWRRNNRDFYNKGAREWRRNNRGRTRAYELRRKYGITLDQYREIFKAQEGKCKICGEEKHNKKYTNLGVDHCHETGKVRGLLCDNCNRGIGNFQDSVELLKAAVSYLEQSKLSHGLGIGNGRVNNRPLGIEPSTER